MATRPSPTMTAAARTRTTLEARLLSCRHMFFFLVLHLFSFIHFSLEKFLKILEIFPYGKTAIYGGGQEGQSLSLLQLRGQANGFCVCVFVPRLETRAGA